MTPSLEFGAVVSNTPLEYFDVAKDEEVVRVGFAIINLFSCFNPDEKGECLLFLSNKPIQSTAKTAQNSLYRVLFEETPTIFFRNKKDYEALFRTLSPRDGSEVILTECCRRLVYLGFNLFIYTGEDGKGEFEALLATPSKLIVSIEHHCVK